MLVLPQHRTRHQAGSTQHSFSQVLFCWKLTKLFVYNLLTLTLKNVYFRLQDLMTFSFKNFIELSEISEPILDFVVVNRSTKRWNLVLGCWRCLIDGNVKCYIINGRLIYKRPKLYWDIALLLKNIKKKQNKNFHKFSI